MPVMLEEIIKSIPLDPKTIVDWTLGHGWHTKEILERFTSIQRLFGFDLDPNILKDTKKRLSNYSDKIEFVWKSYSYISEVLWDIKVDFVLLDLGVNMEHFKDGSRGFSLNIDADLDMRFDDKNGKSAYDILNKYNSMDLAKVFIEYAEFTDQKSQEIARQIIQSRKASPIKTTFDLKKILNQLGLWQKASVVIFQAIRIETNKEIDNLKLFLEQVPNILSDWWKCGIISFHSVEDRLVKIYFKDLCKSGEFKLSYKKALKPNYKEVEKNRASRSAKYRVLEKVFKQN